MSEKNSTPCQYTQVYTTMTSEKDIIRGEQQSFLIRLRPYLTIFFAEFLGSFILLFVGCGSCIDFSGDPIKVHHLNSLGFGFSVLLAIQVFGHISACHINPAVSIVSLLLKQINIVQWTVYVSAQFLGALFGFAMLKFLYPANLVPTGFCVTKFDGSISVIQGFLLELVMTSILCLVVCAVWDPRNGMNSDSTPIRFGLVVTVLSIIGGPLTGASLNTSRTFAPAVFGYTSDWKHHWVYWVAPNLAPFIVVTLYKYIFAEPQVNNGRPRRSEDVASSI